MALVGKHAGEHQPSSYDVAHRPRRRILALALAVLVTLVAWGVLVYEAIDFGSDARSGESTAWVLLAVATVGAAACLFVTLLLGARLLSLLTGSSTPPPAASPARPPGGHRAAR
jgi:RsiW-degrading membrane proteinase PrsW (M82 family)